MYKMTMLISTKATDTIYQAVLHLLEQQGFGDNESLQQHVLLKDGIFLGYRFCAESLQIDWLAQHNSIILKNNEGRILLQKQLSPQKTTAFELPSNNERSPVAA